MHSTRRHRKPRVVMFGPHLQATSGISSVVNNWLEAGFADMVELTYIPTLRHFVPGRVFFKLLEGVKAYLQFISIPSSRFDIAHLHFSAGMSFWRKLVLFRLAKLKGMRTVIHMHAPEFENYYRSSNVLKRSQIRGFFRDADSMLVLSNAWVDICRNICPSARIGVLNNGVEPKKYSGRIEHVDSINIVMMGRLGHRKGTYDLIDAFAQLAPEFPEACLILGGDGEVNQVRDVVRKKRLTNRVKVLGWISGEEKIDTFRAGDIYVLPSYAEGFPGSILEAMAAGLPIVATPVGGVSELVKPGQNGFLVNPGDVSAIRDSLRKLAIDPTLRMRMGERSRHFLCEQFDIREIVRQLVAHYHDLLGDA